MKKLLTTVLLSSILVFPTLAQTEVFNDNGNLTNSSTTNINFSNGNSSVRSIAFGTLPTLADGAVAIEFTLKGGDGGPATWDGALVDLVAEGGEGGTVSFTLPITSSNQGQEFTFYQGKRGQANSDDVLASGGGGGSTAIVNQNGTTLAIAGGGGGGCAIEANQSDGRPGGTATDGKESCGNQGIVNESSGRSAWNGGVSIGHITGESLTSLALGSGGGGGVSGTFTSSQLHYLEFQGKTASAGGAGGQHPASTYSRGETCDPGNPFSLGCYTVTTVDEARGGAGFSGGGAGGPFLANGPNFSPSCSAEIIAGYGGGGGGAGYNGGGGGDEERGGGGGSSWTHSSISGETLADGGTTSSSNNGNNGTVTYRVIYDTEDPTAICQNATLILGYESYLNEAGNLISGQGVEGEVVLDTEDLDGGSTDDGFVAGFSVSQTNFDCSDLGTQTVTLTVTDANGNTDNCQAQVTVVDDHAPTLTAASASIVSDENFGQIDMGASTQMTITPPTLNFEDNCSVASVVQADPFTVTCSDVGTTMIKPVTATDGSGNVRTINLYYQITAPSTRFYVNATQANDNGDGTSWATAKKYLNSAVALTSGCRSEIWVAAGTYYPDEGTGQTDNDRDATFVLESVEMYGGFNGTETEISQRDIRTNETILSGDLMQNDGTSNADNAYHVLAGVTVDSRVVVDGFTITAGNANGSSVNSSGGGAIFVNNAVALNNCIINGNASISVGGGVYSGPGTLLEATNTLFSGNISASDGGAFYNDVSATATIINCTVSGNEADDDGGAFFNASTGNLMLQNTLIWNNKANGQTTTTDASVTDLSNAVTYANCAVANISASGIVSSSDPGFVQGIDLSTATLPSTSGDFHTTEPTVVFNLGENTFNTEAKDLDGNLRIQTGTIDIGVYEQNTCGNFSGIAYVDANASGDNSGVDWENAFTSLESALSIQGCAEVSEIRVALGTYRPSNHRECADCDINIYGISEYYFLLTEDVSLKGGYDPTTGIQTGLSVLDGLHPSGEKAYHILIALDLPNTAQVDGFVIQNGDASRPGSMTVRDVSIHARQGGGVFSKEGATFFNNCVFNDNTSDQDGGALALEDGSSSVITNCVFVRNRRAIFALNSTISSMENCTFYGQTGGSNISQLSGTTNLKNCVFYDNTTPELSFFLAQLDPATSTNNFLEGYTHASCTILTADPFINSSNPEGPDGIFGTGDDGLFPAVGSVIINAGDNASSTASTDVTLNPRIDDGTIDVGAYEFTACTPLVGSPVFVDANAVGSNSGEDWTNAFTSLEEALALQDCGVTEINVASGSYSPSASRLCTNCSGSQDYYFLLQDGVTLKGGFNPSTGVQEYDNLTILDGDLGGNQVHSVLLSQSLNRTSFLDGFIIQNGLADGGSNRTVNGKSHSRAKGGGINSLNADLEIHNCWVRGNECDVSGGGIFLGNTDCSIYNTVISGNVAGSQGGGITESGSDLTIINTTVAGNYALGGGGATGFFDAVNSIIWGNDASSFSPETFGSISFDYSLVKDANPPGTGNLNGTSASNDPMFINPITASLTPTILGDYRVSPCPVSPVVDAGSNGANSTAFALGGDARKLDGDNNGNARIDIGAYESELPILTSSISVSACDSYTVPSGDETYLTSQIVTDTISGSCGADSVITIDLAIEFNDVIQDDIATDTICGFESLSYSASTSFVSYADFESANSDYINLNVLADDIAESDRSVFMWINSAAVSSREALFAINSNTGGNISLWFINSDNEFELYDGSGYETSGVVVADESWHYVGYTYSETTSETKLYVDGVEVLTHIDVQFADAYSQISLGQEFDGTNTTNHYNGLMTEVSVWNAVLSPTDIVTAMSAAIEPSHPAYSSLVGYYPMNSTCGTSLELVEDFSGNEEHAMASSSEIVKLDDLQEIPTFNSTYWYNLEWNSTKAGSFSTAENVAPSVDTTTAFSLRYTRDFVEVTEYWAVVEAGSLIDVSVTDASPTFTANTTGLAYQWLDCDNGYAIISGETDQTFTAMGSGNYAVEVTQDGCADTSACYNATIIGLEGKGLEKSISVYPNPTSNDINVEIESFSSETVTIEVYDQLGRTIQTGSIAKDVSRKTTLSLDGYGAGSYFVKCYTHTSTKYFKVVKI